MQTVYEIKYICSFVQILLHIDYYSKKEKYNLILYVVLCIWTENVHNNFKNEFRIFIQLI